MSEFRRVFSSTRINEKKNLDEKENICDINKFKKLSGTKSQKVTSSKKFDLNYTSRDCYCKAYPRKDGTQNDFKSTTKKEPFKIHIDGYCNDLTNTATVRERMIKYDTYRIEKLKKNAPLLEQKQKDRFSSNMLEPDRNSIRYHLQSLKKNKECLPNTLVSRDKALIRSVQPVFGIQSQQLPISATKSLLDLSKIKKQSTLTKSEKNPCFTKFTSPFKKQTSDVRSRSCSSKRSVFLTRNRTNSTSAINEGFIDQEDKHSRPIKCKLLTSSKESLFSDVISTIRSESLKKQVSAISLFKSKSGSILINKDNYLQDQKEQKLVNRISTKIKTDLKVVRQTTDFSPYLLYHSDYLAGILKIEKEKEDNSPKLSSEYLDKYANSEPRNIIITFLIHLATHCRYPSSILYQTVKLFDAFLDTISIEITDMQLVAVTALWIVLKKDGNLNKIPSVARSILALVQDQKLYSIDLLAEWEKTILCSLKFNILFSDPYSIFVFYIINCNYDQSKISSNIISKIYYCGGYVMDLTLLNVNFCYATSNHLALATAELVMCIVLSSDDDLLCPQWHAWRRILTDGVNMPININDNEINSLRTAMISLVLDSGRKHTMEETVRKRYSHSRYGNISNFFLEKVKKIPPEEYMMSM
ncbi:hypothetical protein M0802_013624 [Mischocyttarus mexicanus]|nr:hypothetical protein M0802_013624 [Mischocyttarus mexicanus]